MQLIYNLLFPFAFPFFVPGMLYKLIRRPGVKRTFLERFSLFGKQKKHDLQAMRGSVWIHAVSVGETMVALSMIRKWQEAEPEQRFFVTTTTTTGQELAQTKAPAGVSVLFCPIDFIWFVRRVLNLLQPSLVIIFETEIWPNMIIESRRRDIPVCLVNARISDRSIRGYLRFKRFFAPILSRFSFIAVQSEDDGKRFSQIAPNVPIHLSGNMKFDQEVPRDLTPISLEECFGPGEKLILLAASTHPGEEALIASTYARLREKHPDLRLIIVPRHAERAADVCKALTDAKLTFHQRTQGSPNQPVDCLLADTTGELMGFIKAADIVIMGKSLAGQDEGHNLIEPALLAKPIVTGSVLRNFRFVLQVLKNEEAVITVDADTDLQPALQKLIEDETFRKEIGLRGQTAISRHRGSTDKTIQWLKETL